MTITIQITETTPCGTTTTLFNRDYASRAGARKGLTAAIWREVKAWGAADDVSWTVAEREAARWMADTDFSETIQSWGKASNLTIAALV